MKTAPFFPALAALLCCALTLAPAPPARAQQGPSPFDADPNIAQYRSNAQFVPKVLYGFLPDEGNAIYATLNQATPNGSVLTETARLLYQSFMPGGNGRTLWVTMASLCVCAFLLQAAAAWGQYGQGKIELPELLYLLGGKPVLTIFLFGWVLPNLPWLAIAVTDEICSGITFIGSIPTAWEKNDFSRYQQKQNGLKLYEGYVRAKCALYANQLKNTAYGVLSGNAERKDQANRFAADASGWIKTYVTTVTPEADLQAIANQNNPLSQAASSGLLGILSSMAQGLAQTAQGAVSAQNYLTGVSGDYADRLDAAVVYAAERDFIKLMQQITGRIRQIAGASATQGQADGTANGANGNNGGVAGGAANDALQVAYNLIGESLRAPRIDYNELSRPALAYQTAANIALAYVVVIIWTLPLGGLVWAFLYALPDALGTGAHLHKVITTLIALMLSVILVCVWMQVATVVGLQQMTTLQSKFNSVNPLLNLSLISGNLSWVGIVLCLLIITSPAQAFALVVAGNLTHDMARDAMAHARSGSLPGTGWLSARTLGNFGGFQTPKGVEAATRSQALSHFQSK
jgi:hypothetical protein